TASDLVVVTEGDLTIAADIQIPDMRAAPAGTAPVNVRLVSLHGQLTINPNVRIAGGVSAPVAPGMREGRGLTGLAGGHIYLQGRIVVVNGTVEGSAGGEGGAPADTAATSPAVGGDGGRGGNVFVG